MRMHKNLGHPSKELLCHASRIGGANKIAIRAANELMCDVCSENKPPTKHLPAKVADSHTKFNRGGVVDLFVLADSNEPAFEFLNIADLATRFNICFPVRSKRPDDVLSVLEMVWINWAGPMSHPISDMGGHAGTRSHECVLPHSMFACPEASALSSQSQKALSPERGDSIAKVALPLDL